jgi:hypothetical protein
MTGRLPLTAGELVFEIEAPSELSAEASRLEMLQSIEMGPFLDLLGLNDVGAPIRIVLVAEGSVVAERVPSWIAGFARGNEDLVVLFPGRVPTYPYSSLPELVRHEVAHVLIDRASGGAELPRWFHEGLAMTAEGSWRMADRSRLAMAMLRSREPTVDQLTALFSSGDEQRIAWAYAVSGALVRDLLQRHGREAESELLAETRRGIEFDRAFFSILGSTPTASLAAFWHRSALWYRWFPFLTSSTVLWIAVTLLALLAIKRRRERDRRIHEAWEAEEAWLARTYDDLTTNGTSDRDSEDTVH